MRLGSVLEAAFNEIYLFDAQTLRFVAVSRGALQNLGYSLDEMRAMTPVDLKEMTDEDFAAITAPLRDGREKLILFEAHHRRKDGSRYPVEIRLQLLPGETPPVYLAILQDISERNAAARLLAEQNALLRRQSALLDLAQALVRNLDDRIIYWNRRMERLYGWTEAEALNCRSQDLLKTRFPIPLADITAALYRFGHWEGELIHTHRDGRQLTVVSYWALHRDAEGKPTAVLEVNTDITAQKQAEEAVMTLNATLEKRVSERTMQLEQANRELESFSYTVSHDLRGPLRGIDGFSQALLEDYGDVLDDEGRHYLRRVRQATERMGQLIDDLMALGRITRAEMHVDSIDLSELATQVAAALESVDPSRAVRFVAEPGLRANADGALLRILLENLLSNAWKFTGKRPKAEIEFGAIRAPENTVYFVRDNGVGFDMAYADKLFGPFQRLHRTSEFEGTGIGLVTVARIVHRHGGRIWAESEVGQGACFYFTLQADGQLGRQEYSA